MQTLEISNSILKQNKILQVDYFNSFLIKTDKSQFKQLSQSFKPSRQQQKLLRYFENQDNHNETYFRFKRLVNKKYFKKQLSQDYKNISIAQTINGDQSFRHPKFQQMTSRMFQSVPFSAYNNNSANLDFFQSFKQTQRKTNISDRKYQSKTTQYYKDEVDISIKLENQEQNGEFKSSKKLQKSIYVHSFQKGLKKYLQRKRPMTQQLNRKDHAIKQIIKKSVVQKNPTNIRHKLKSLSQNRNREQNLTKSQKCSILDIISKKKLIQFLSNSVSIDPRRKGIYSIKDLSDFQRFQLSFINYMKLKTKQKIDSYAYQNKVRKRDSNLDKFQKFILDQFTIDNQGKRKLQTIFQNIQYEFHMAQRRKIIEKR